MAVPVTIADLSVTEGSNSPLDSDSITASTRPSDYLRAQGAILRTLAASSTLAAGATTDLSTVVGTFITLTGTAVTITALGTLAAGIYKYVIFNAAHTLTHNATSLILLGGANRTVAAGDVSLFVSEGSGNWRELAFSDATGYQPLDADLTAIAALTTTAFGRGMLEYADAATAFAALKQAATETATGVVELATSAEVQTGTDTSRAITPAGLAASKIVAGTAVASTSGTAIDFTGIPSWAKRVTIMFDGVSTNGTSYKLLQLGDSGGIETTGYASASGTQSGTSSNVITSTAGFVAFSGGAAELLYGQIVISVLNAATNTWVCTGNLAFGGATAILSLGGSKSLSAALDRVRITTVNGTDAFDAGSINILYE